MITVIFLLIAILMISWNMKTINLIYDREGLGDMIARGIATDEHIDAKVKSVIASFILYLLVVILL